VTWDQWLNLIIIPCGGAIVIGLAGLLAAYWMP